MADVSASKANIRRRATGAVAYAAGQLQANLKVTSPQRTGELRQQTTVRASELEAVAAAATDYASFVRQPGTRPHVIRPRRKRVLSFLWHGERVFFPRVNHPGYRGSDWWDRGLAKWQDLLREGLRRAN